MKKKLSLLLVLSLVLSMMPMNAFGAEPFFLNPPPSVSPIVTVPHPATAPAEVTVNLDLNWFVGKVMPQSAPIVLYAEITGHDDNQFVFAGGDKLETIGGNANIQSPGGVHFAIGEWVVYGDKLAPENTKSVRFDFYSDDGASPGISTPGAIQGVYSVPIDFKVRIAASGNIVIRLNDKDGEVIFNRPVASIRAGAGLEFDTARVVNFSSSLLLAPLRLKETGVPTFTNELPSTNLVTVELRSPEFYRWFIGNVGGVGAATLTSNAIWNDWKGTAAKDKLNNVGAGALAAHGDAKIITDPGNSRREILQIMVNVERIGGSAALAQLLGELRFENLWLQPEDRARATGDVFIDVKVYNGAIGTGQKNIGADNNWFALKVAVRGGSELVAEAGDPAKVRSGTLGEDGGKYKGVKTQTVFVTEITPNSWGSTLSTPTIFSFDNEHVTVLGAQVMIMETGGNRNWDDRTDFNKSKALWWYEDWLSVADNLYPAQVGGVMMNQREVRVTYPAQNASNANQTIEMMITFYLSIEAGYIHKGYDSIIDVVVGGSGVANLDGGGAVIPVAEVYDPVTVEIDSVGKVETSATYFTGSAPVGDIVISEQNGFQFAVGQELWLYAIGAGNRLDVSFSANRFVEATDGLRVSPGLQLRHQMSNYWLDGMVYVIERQSYNKEGTITVKDGVISGNVFPGVDYRVVVSGESIADNDQLVWSAEKSGVVAGSFPTVNYGVFYADPFPVSAVEFSQKVADDAAPGGTQQGPGQGTVNNATLPTLFIGQSFSGVEAVYIERPNTIGTHNVGYVALAAMRELFNAANPGSTTTNWVAETQTATLTGTHKNGGAVTVSITVNSPYVTINGVQHDIATFVGMQSGPAGSVVAIFDTTQNQNYLPIRCIANAFGWAVERVGNQLLFR